jgi:hypothetical protein
MRLYSGRATLVFAAVLSLLVAGCDSTASPSGLETTAGALGSPDHVSYLAGFGAESGAALSGVVEVYVESGTTARLVVTNTSPAESSTEPNGPVLTRLAFNLLGGPAASCFAVASDGRFALARRVQPLCGANPQLGAPFAYSLDAVNPAPSKGIARGESLEILLTVTGGCGFAFTEEAFDLAPTSPSGGQLTQWAAKFQVVGPGGEDSGCAQGTTPPEREIEYVISEFIATAAEVQAAPSLFRELDTRAGSIEANFYGGKLVGFTSDAPFTSGILALRNGAGNLIEQWQVNRMAQPFNLDPNGCKLVTTSTTQYLQCWVKNFLAPVQVAVPTTVADSNAGFDPESPTRVTISGLAEIDATGDPTDNSAQWLTITWEDPVDINTARMNFRLHFDANFNGLADDPIYPLYRVRFGTPDIHEPFVIVVAQTATSVTVTVNVQDAMDFVWDKYLDIDGYLP